MQRFQRSRVLSAGSSLLRSHSIHPNASPAFTNPQPLDSFQSPQFVQHSSPIWVSVRGIFSSPRVMAPAYIGAIDQGTTSTRFILYNELAHQVASHQIEHRQICPQAGWVEHNPLEILQRTRECIEATLQKGTEEGLQFNSETIKAIGITNQRETTLVWSRQTGKPLYNAIVWLDIRTRTLCKSLADQFPDGVNHFRGVTGLPISTYFSAVKMRWLLENVPEVREAVETGDAMFGTVDTWLIWNLTGGSTGGARFVTDCTNAARTMLMDLRSLDWHQGSLDELGIKREVLPEIVSNSEEFGRVAEGWPLAGVPITGCLGDQMAATLGQRCKKGEAKNTYGTGCFLLLNTGKDIVSTTHGLLTTVAYKLGPNAETQYALEGSIAVAGGAVQWLRDNLGFIRTSAEIETLSRTVQDTGGVYFVPAFSGLFAPRWRNDARGVIVGLTQYSNKAHIARAVLEAIAFQTKEVLDAMLKDLNWDAGTVLRVDGGASQNDLLMQIQADLLGRPVLRPDDVETTALGAALAAGLAVGVWTEADVFSNKLGKGGVREFKPTIEETSRETRYRNWCRAVEKSLNLDDAVGTPS